MLRDHVELKPYQKEGAQFALLHPYSMIADEPGLGKTIQAIYAAIQSKRPSLVICPSYLTDTWCEEVEKMTTCSVERFFHKKKLEYKAQFLVASYNQLPYLLDTDRKHIIMDESHLIKTPTAKRTNNAVQLIHKKRPDFLTMLSGTPIKNRVPEIYVPLYLAAQHSDTEKKITDRYGSYFTFCHRFTKTHEMEIPYFDKNGIKRKRKVTKFYDIKNEDELKSYIRCMRIRRLAKDVLDLKTPIEKDVTVYYEENHDLYDIYEAFKPGELSATSTLKMESACLKSAFTAEYVNDLLEQDVGPIICFSDHRKPLDLIRKGLNTDKVCIIDGTVDPDKRAAYVKKFQNGDYDVLLGTIGSMGMGYTLTRSNHMVFNDLCWVPADLWQAMKRIDRIGQTKVPMYHFIQGTGPDKKINNSLRQKIKLIRSLS